MAQLGLAVGGAVLGSATGISGGAGYGFLAGSLLGSLLFPGPGVSQPKLEDEQVRFNVYGSPMAIGYGTVRMAGQPIWGTGRIATQHTEGGKGGPEYSYYTYSSKFAVHFADRQSVTYLRLWINGTLIEDHRGDSSDPTAVYSNSENVTVTFYDGSQVAADPVMESYLGAGNVPAYKGQTFMVVEINNLEDFGNVGFPAVEAEISFAVASVYPWETIYEGSKSSPNNSALLLNINRKDLYIYHDELLAKIDSETYSVIINKNAVNEIGFTIAVQGAVLDQKGHFWIQPLIGNSTGVFELDQNLNLVGRVGLNNRRWYLDAWRYIQGFSSFAFLKTGGFEIGVALSFLGRLQVFSTSNRDLNFPLYYQFFGEYQLEGFSLQGNSKTNLQVDRNNHIWAASSQTGKLYRFKIVITANTDLNTFPGTNNLSVVIHEEWDFTGTIDNIDLIMYHEDEHALLCFSSGQVNSLIAKWDIDTETFIDTYSDLGNNNQPGGRGNFQIGVQNGKVIVGSFENLKIISVSDFKLVGGPYDLDNWIDPGSNGWIWHEPTNSIYAVDETSGNNRVVRIYLDRYSAAAEDLEDVNVDLCIRSGRLAEADINASDLAGNDVRGYLIASQTTAANAIRTLQPGYLYDAIESDDKIKMLMRPQSSSFTVPEDHLGPIENSKLVEKYGQESDLPERVSVTFSNYNQAYNPVTQQAKRVADAISTRQRLDMQVPVVFTPDEGRQVAEKILFTSWTERVEHKTNLPPRYLLLDPADVGTITLGSTTFTVRNVECNYGANRALALQAVQQDEETYSSAVTGYGGDGTGWDPSITIPDFTDLFILDVPYLLDAHSTNDATVPLYMAFAPLGDHWDGAFLFKSADTYVADQILTALQSVTYGYTTTKLHGATRADGSEFWATLDRYGSVTIYLENGSVSTVTLTQMLNGANAAAIKSGDNWEIIQFQTVTDNGDGSYTLFGLLRGRRGTNKWINDHAVGDTFILLSDSTVKKYNAPTADIGSLRYYKSMTIGGIFEDVDWDEFTLAANSFKPYSPAYIKGSRDGSNNLTITWKRRTRVGGAWLDGSGTVPIAEESESYEVDILNSGGSVIRTIDSLTAASASYSAADQTTDFGSAQSEVSVAVYQKNATKGRGFAGEAVV